VLCIACVLTLAACNAEDRIAPKRVLPRAAFGLSDGYGLLTVGIGGPGRISNTYPPPPHGEYVAMVSGGNTANYFYLWSVRECYDWDACPGNGTWYQYASGVNANPQTVYVSPNVVLLEVKVEAGEWTGEPGFVGKSGISDGRLTFGPAGFGSGGGFNVCGDDTTGHTYPFTRDTVVPDFGDTLKIDYKYKKCQFGRIFSPYGPYE